MLIRRPECRNGRIALLVIFFVTIAMGTVHAGLAFLPTQVLTTCVAIDGALPAVGEVIDCNENGIDDALDIFDLTSPDCNQNGIPDECDIKENSTAPGGPFFCTDQCDPDCNHSGVPDECELAGNDCNFDGRPDECGVFVTCDEMPWLQEQKVTASDADWPDNFGYSVSISGDTAVVGARDDNCAVEQDCGAAYVYRFDGTTWIEQQKLTASDAAREDEFGNSVSINGDTIVVGAPRSDFGTAYVYRFDGASWIERQKLTASNGAGNDLFGSSVSIVGDTIVIGAPGQDCPGVGNCGSAYVYRFGGTSWIVQQELTASDPASQGSFGTSVSISGDTLIVGASEHDCQAGSDCGAAYVFRFDGITWLQDQKLSASDAESFDYFGSSVSLSGGTAIVGANFADCAAGGECGAAYVYRFDGANWMEEQKLTASDASWGDHFGNSVSIGGDTAVVGAPLETRESCYRCGAAYVYRSDGTTWIEQEKLTAIDASESDHFGNAVSISHDTALVGAHLDDCAAGDDCGSAYMIDLSGDDCNCNGVADQCDNADCNGNGIPDVCEGLPDCDADGFTDRCEPDGDNDGIPDDCDDCPNGSNTADSDGDGVPDGCDICPGFDDAGIDSDGDGIPDTCDACPDGDDSVDSDGDGVPDDCDICEGGDDTIDSDGDAVPDDCDICPGADDTIDSDNDTVPDDCDACPGGDDLLDGDGDGVPDDCDNCNNNLPETCTLAPPILAPPPHDILKNRYISVDPRGEAGINIGLPPYYIRIELASSLVNGVTGTGPWWAGLPDANCLSVVTTSQPPPLIWDDCPILHLTGCPIIPTSTYEISAVIGGLLSGPPLVAATQAKPGVKWHGDCVGHFNGSEWTAPNFTVSIDDAVAAIKTFQNPSKLPGCGAPPCNATHVSVTDMAPNLTPGPHINNVVGIEDVFSIILGFQGTEYPGPDLTLCPP